LITLLCVTLIGAGVNVILPLTVSAIIDRVVPNNSYSSLQLIMLVLVACSIFDSISTMIRGKIIAVKSTEITTRISDVLFSSLFALPAPVLLGEAGRKNISSVVSLNTFRSHVQEIISFAVQILSSFVFLLLLIFVNFYLLIVVVAGVMLHFLVYLMLRPQMKPLLRQSMSYYEEYVQLLQSRVQAIETIKAFGLSDKARDMVAEASDKAFSYGLAASFSTMTAGGVSRLVLRLVEASVVCIGGLEVMSGSMTIGELVAFQMFASRLFEPLSRLPNAWEYFHRAREYTERWRALVQLGEQSDGDTKPLAPTDTKYVLDVNGLSFSYPERAPVIEDLDLQISAGEILFLLGPSGCGKSTLVRLIIGLLQPTHGCVRISGAVIHQVDEKCRKNFVSCSTQEPVLLSGTVRENVASFDQKTSGVDVIKAVKAASADLFLDRLPLGLDTDLGAHGIELSGGERQRLCIARMLATRSRLFVMDEATTGLNRELEIRTLQNVIVGLAADQALVIITHREDLARMGTRVIRLDEGKVVSDIRTDRGLTR
jgi:subfamily B ATP-binding cassette protein HlyB/CyaB